MMQCRTTSSTSLASYCGPWSFLLGGNPARYHGSYVPPPLRNVKCYTSPTNNWSRRPLLSLMPCLLVILLLAFPRIALALLFFFSSYLERAYHGLILPLLGFVFLPLTTLAYAWMVNTRQPTAGINLLILVVAVVIDLGGLGGGGYHRRR